MVTNLVLVLIHHGLRMFCKTVYIQQKNTDTKLIMAMCLIIAVGATFLFLTIELLSL